MGFAEKRGNYWRGRYRQRSGQHVTVKDALGAVVHFRTKREAERAANEAEAKLRAGGHRNPDAGRTTFGEFVSRWYATQDPAASTMQNYRRHIEEHLLPTFEDHAVADILPSDVAAWEKAERAVGYAESSIKTWRSTLHLILADAVEDGLRDSNPAARRRGRGKRAGRSRRRGPEKVVTDALGILLIAERAALLSGRDDEFVAVVLMGFTGMRWGEVVGLETRFVRPAVVRVEWQLYELDSGELHRCPPKDESHRTIDTPAWLGELLSDHMARTEPTACECHRLTYAFRGHGAASPAARQSGTKLVDVARRAGVSVGTASAALNRPESVPAATRARVEVVAADLGYVRGGPAVELAPHWRRNGFARGCFSRRLPAGTRGRLPNRRGRCRCWPTRGPGCGGAGYAAQVDGRTDGARGRVGAGPLLARHRRDEGSAPGPADRPVGGGSGRATGAVLWVAGGGVGRTARRRAPGGGGVSFQDLLPIRSKRASTNEIRTGT